MGDLYLRGDHSIVEGAVSQTAFIGRKDVVSTEPREDLLLYRAGQLHLRGELDVITPERFSYLLHPSGMPE